MTATTRMAAMPDMAHRSSIFMPLPRRESPNWLRSYAYLKHEHGLDNHTIERLIDGFSIPLGRRA